MKTSKYIKQDMKCERLFKKASLLERAEKSNFWKMAFNSRGNRIMRRVWRIAKKENLI